MLPISIYPLPAYEIFLAGLVFILLARLAWRRRSTPPFRFAIATAVLGVSLTLLSGMLRHERHAGTRIQITNGWPKPMFVRWLADDSSPSAHAVAARGVAENLYFYTALASLIVSVGRRPR